jgi:uncharacterized protein YbjT (DUF2867 family)
MQNIPYSRVVVFGATGATGRHFLKLIQGQTQRPIVAIVRPGRAHLKSGEGIQVIEGESTNPHFVESTLADGDLVISFLGQNRKTRSPWSPLTSPKDTLEQSTRNIIRVLEKRKGAALIYTSAYGVDGDWNKLPLWFRGVILMSNVRHAYADHAKAEQLIRNSRLPYLIVKPVLLVDGEKAARAVELRDEPVSAFAQVNRQALARFVWEKAQGPLARGQIEVSGV